MTEKTSLECSGARLILQAEKKKATQEKMISSGRLQLTGRPAKQEEKKERKKKKEQGIRKRRNSFSPEEETVSDEIGGKEAVFILNSV